MDSVFGELWGKGLPMFYVLQCTNTYSLNTGTLDSQINLLARHLRSQTHYIETDWFSCVNTLRTTHFLRPLPRFQPFFSGSDAFSSHKSNSVVFLLELTVPFNRHSNRSHKDHLREPWVWSFATCRCACGLQSGGNLRTWLDLVVTWAWALGSQYVPTESLRPKRCFWIMVYVQMTQRVLQNLRATHVFSPRAVILIVFRHWNIEYDSL